MSIRAIRRKEPTQILAPEDQGYEPAGRAAADGRQKKTAAEVLDAIEARPAAHPMSQSHRSR